MLLVPPLAAEPDKSLELELFIDEPEDELPPAAAPESMLELELLGVPGQEHVDALGVELPLTAEPEAVELVDGEVLLVVLDGEELPPALEDGSELAPLAALEPEPVVEDWLVCAL
jgi:hypothetical protein